MTGLRILGHEHLHRAHTPSLHNLNLLRGFNTVCAQLSRCTGRGTQRCRRVLHLAPQQVKRDDHAPLSRIFCLSCCPLLLLQRLTLLRAANGLATKLAGF